MHLKKKILFLSPYPSKIVPSQRFRFEQYFPFLSRYYIITQKTFWDKKGWEILFSDKNDFIKLLWLLIKAFGKRFFLLFHLQKYDLIFIHREVSHLGPPVFEWIIKYILRKKIIYDFDDAIWLLNYSDKNRISKFFKSPWKTKYICKWANSIIAGNSYLADYAKKYNKNVFVIPTTIDTSYHKNKYKEHKTLTIGWTGTLTTLKYLNAIVPVLKQLEEKYNLNFLIISNEKPKLNLKFTYKSWCKETEIEDLRKIDIGIMPLYNNIWEKGKCGFKGLQYMALEIPTIMSPVGVNTEIIEDGVNGFLASTEQEWFDKLSLLIEDKELRQRLGKAGRNTVMEKYSVEANKQKYLDVFNYVFSS